MAASNQDYETLELLLADLEVVTRDIEGVYGRRRKGLAQALQIIPASGQALFVLVVQSPWKSICTNNAIVMDAGQVPQSLLLISYFADLSLI